MDMEHSAPIIEMLIYDRNTTRNHIQSNDSLHLGQENIGTWVMSRFGKLILQMKALLSVVQKMIHQDFQLVAITENSHTKYGDERKKLVQNLKSYLLQQLTSGIPSRHLAR